MIVNKRAIPSGNCIKVGTVPPGKWEYYKNLASIVCSRESTYRAALDLTAFDIPVMFSDLFRGPKKFIETAFETLVGALMIFISPSITSFVGNLAGRLVLPKNMQKDTSHYLRFNMAELHDLGKFASATERIKTEECEDKTLVGKLHEKSGNSKMADYYRNEVQGIKEFCDSFKSEEENRKQIYKLKKATIVAESLVEGIWWGGTGIIVRAFRKYILGVNRFTGTMSYTSKAESEKLGETGNMSWFQTLVGLVAIPSGAIINYILLTKAENTKVVEKSKFLQVIRNQFDMTHALFPKIGLLFSMTIIPKYIGVLTTSQGWFERFERLFRLVSVVPSWWLGHRATNGVFASMSDKYLSEKYKVKPGILIEKEYLNINKNDSIFTKIGKILPEPAKIHHIMKVTEGNKKLQDEAEDQHAKSLYKGFTAHSIFVWLVCMLVNKVTKMRVLGALGKG